jgi:NADH-quinone oxidoreductase subunit C
MSTVPELGRHSWPVMASVDGIVDHLRALLGDAVVAIVEHAGEVGVTVTRAGLVAAMTALRDDQALRLNQLIDICGVDYPDRIERFEIVYQLLSMAKNLRLRVKVSTDARTPVPSLTGVWPVAGWYERETWGLLWRAVRRQPRSAPHPHRLWFRRPSVPQGFPADRPCRTAVFRGTQARRL